MHDNSDTRPRIGALVAACAAVLALSTGTARAWDINVEIPYGDYFGITTFSGDYTFDLVSRSVNAEANDEPSLPHNFVVQNWSGTSWPSENLTKEVGAPVGCIDAGCTLWGGANIYSYDASVQVPDSFNTYLYGTLPVGHTAGVSVRLDYLLTLAAGSRATVEIFDGDLSLSIETSQADAGDGFASIAMYESTRDVNVFGGANQPFAATGLVLRAAGASFQDATDGFSYEFVNSSGDVVSYNLRLELNASLYVPLPVPEPQSYAMLLAGLGILAWRLRSTRG